MSAFVDERREGFGVEAVCRTLGVSASAYYQRATGERSARVVDDERLLALILKTHAANYEAYGARRMWKVLVVRSQLSAEGPAGAVCGHRLLLGYLQLWPRRAGLVSRTVFGVHRRRDRPRTQQRGAARRDPVGRGATFRVGCGQAAGRADGYLKARLFTIAYQALNSCNRMEGTGERCPNGQLHIATLTARALHIGTRPGQVRQTAFSRDLDVFKGVSTSTSGNKFTIIQRPAANFETSNTYVCRTAIAGAGCLGRRW